MEDITASVALIAGGNTALRGEFPHHVGIFNGSELHCGGSIISTVLILTAAHCLEQVDPRVISVIAGKHDRTHLAVGEQIRGVGALYIHENYTTTGNSVKNDIGLILLNEPLIYTKYVQNISLPKKGEEIKGPVTLVGWGSREFDGYEAMVLRKVTVPVVSNQECRRSYGRNSLPQEVTNLMMCAGTAGKDSCDGDSGGAVLCGGKGRDFVLCAIVSWGEDCGKPGYPGVNTKVAPYLDWIANAEKKMGERRRCRTDEFFCSSKCIPRTSLCDFLPDCADGSDENRCGRGEGPCSRTQFQCDNGLCTYPEYVCDGEDDCLDGSDELKCPVNPGACSADEHQCGVVGRCIPLSWRCDGLTDCDDNSDERNCPASQGQRGIKASPENFAPYYLAMVKCASDQFYCSSKCISRTKVCNLFIDCEDGADEALCTGDDPCEPGEHRCGTGFCLGKTMLCDGDVDCLDFSDEVKCPGKNVTCKADEFPCGAGGRCIPNTWLNDGMQDCDDGEDEMGNELANLVQNKKDKLNMFKIVQDLINT